MNFRKVIFLVAIFLTLIPYVGDNDFWLHLRTGEVIVTEGHFPRTDIISFTNEGKEWVNHAWLSQVILYVLFKYGGFLVISLFTALAGTVLFALMVRGRELSWPLISFLLLIAYGLRPFIVPRPQIFAYLLLLCLILSVDWFYRTKSKKIIFLLPAILFLWGNIHASVILAVPVLFFILVFEFGPFSEFNFRKPSLQERRWLLAGSLLALGASLISPFGYKIFWHALQPLRFSEAYNALIETQPVYEISLFLLLIHLLVIASFVWQMFKRPVIFKLYESVLLILFAVMPLASVKYLSFSWMVILPIIVKTFPEIRKKLLNKLVLAAIAVLSVILFFRAGNLFRDAHDEWPKKLLGFIQENALKGNVYHSFGWSGYVAWETKRPVFNNPTLTDLGGDVFRDGLDFEKAERVDEFIDKYDLSIIISPPWIPMPYAISLKNDWALVYWDNFGVVFAKRGIGNDEAIRKHGLDIKYFNDSIEGVLRKYEPGEIPELIENYKKAIERQPDLLLARYRLGLIYQLLGVCPAAIEQFNKLTELDYELGNAHFRLAECYQKTGEFKLVVQEEELGEKYVKKERWWKGRR